MNEKEFWKSKLFWFGLLYIVLGVAEHFGYSYYEPSPLITGILVVILRCLTDKKITFGRIREREN